MKKDEVMGYIDPEYAVSLTQQLIRIPSENNDQNERSKDRTPIVTLLCEQFKTWGVEPRLITAVEGRPNVYAEVKGDREGPTFMLMAHADTIGVTETYMKLWSSDPFTPYIKDGKLYGVGSSDDKCGVAAIVGAVKAIVKSGIRFNGKIVALICTGSEGGARGGYRELMEQNLFPQADAVIQVDASDRRIVRQYKGSMYYEFVVHGKFSYISEPEKGINAVEKMSDVIQALKKIKFTDYHDPVLGKVDFTVTNCNADNIMGSIPAKCTMTADMRMIPGFTSKQAIRMIQAVLDKLMREDKDLNVVMNVSTIKEACELPLDHPVVRATVQAMEKIVGRAEFAPGTMSGGGFSFWRAGIPSVFFGPGSSAQAHMPDEYVEVTRIEEVTRIIALAALNFLGAPG